MNATIFIERLDFDFWFKVRYFAILPFHNVKQHEALYVQMNWIQCQLSTFPKAREETEKLLYALPTPQTAQYEFIINLNWRIFDCSIETLALFLAHKRINKFKFYLHHNTNIHHNRNSHLHLYIHIYVDWLHIILTIRSFRFFG